MDAPLRIAQVASPMERVPPLGYGGTERIVHGLVVELDRRGHDVTTFASGDSDVPGRLVPTAAQALRPTGSTADAAAWIQFTVHRVLDRIDDFDLIHSHLEWPGLVLARLVSIPVVSTFHGRLDLPWAATLLGESRRGLVAISRNQADTHPSVPWEAVVHNGLRLADAPFERRRSDALCFVGRIAEEKGVVDAIEIARRTGRPLRIAAKVAPDGPEHDYFASVFRPALQAAGRDVEFLGELTQGERDRLFAESHASLMPGAWPEPFGLVAIEALATGTPVIARRIGALPEIIREGIDGFFGDDAGGMAFQVDRVDGLDRAAIRAAVIERFSVERMTDAYEVVYRRLLGLEPAAMAPVEPGLDALVTGHPGDGAIDRPGIADLTTLAGNGR